MKKVSISKDIFRLKIEKNKRIQVYRIKDIFPLFGKLKIRGVDNGGLIFNLLFSSSLKKFKISQIKMFCRKNYFPNKKKNIKKRNKISGILDLKNNEIFPY